LIQYLGRLRLFPKPFGDFWCCHIGPKAAQPWAELWDELETDFLSSPLVNLAFPFWLGNKTGPTVLIYVAAFRLENFAEILFVDWHTANHAMTVFFGRSLRELRPFIRKRFGNIFVQVFFIDLSAIHVNFSQVSLHNLGSVALQIHRVVEYLHSADRVLDPKVR
jgi:hypothetical protein